MTANPQFKSDVLVVDDNPDNPDNLRLIGAGLEEQSYRVRQAPSGALALNAARFESPEVILLDINMPEMDGYETCRQLKAIEGLEDVPVIFLSCLIESHSKLRGFECGAVDYITKPCNIDEVSARIDSHVAASRLRTERQSRYDELAGLMERRQSLIQMIAHDIRNPITMAASAIDYVLNHSSKKMDPESSELLSRAVNQSNVAESLINDMLDTSRLENRQMSVQIGDYDLTYIVGYVTTNFVLNERRLIVDVADGCMARCDAGLTQRILANLLGNAVKFTPAGGEIRIVARPVEGGICVEVHDTGAGVPPEFHDKIFEEFGQVESAECRGAPSTGLGLFFCRLAIEAQDGVIGLQSTLGKGSLFWFTLPAAAAPDVNPIPQGS
ncbi:MAG: two-component system sensor histidine kinase/response regulator [Verrucomicrobiales bacterium]|jgi:two-component system sensor histidine kinase/response regulator